MLCVCVCVVCVRVVCVVCVLYVWCVCVCVVCVVCVCMSMCMWVLCVCSMCGVCVYVCVHVHVLSGVCLECKLEYSHKDEVSNSGHACTIVQSRDIDHHPEELEKVENIPNMHEVLL